MAEFNLLSFSPTSLNLLSFMLGMLFAATMYRAKAMMYVSIYFIGVAVYFAVKYYVH